MADTVKLALYKNLLYMLQILKDLKVIARWKEGMGAVAKISWPKFFCVFLSFGRFFDKRLFWSQAKTPTGINY